VILILSCQAVKPQKGRREKKTDQPQSAQRGVAAIKRIGLSHAKTQRDESFAVVGICSRVMLNEMKHLLCAFFSSYRQDGKVKSRFFVAEFILSIAEGLLRMTNE
jgi:hypothetical protein